MCDPRTFPAVLSRPIGPVPSGLSHRACPVPLQCAASRVPRSPARPNNTQMINANRKKMGHKILSWHGDPLQVPCVRFTLPIHRDASNYCTSLIHEPCDQHAIFIYFLNELSIWQGTCKRRDSEAKHKALSNLTLLNLT